jgi:transposase
MPEMKKRDGRSLDHKTLEELRRLAVARVLAGEEQTAVASSLSVNRTTVVRWMMTYRAKGEDGLAAKRVPGRTPTLTEEQRGRLRTIIVSKNPRQLGFGMALWTVRLVAQVIEREFGVVLHETTVSRMLNRMGLVPRKPIKRSFSRNDDECREWAQVVFPNIVREVRRKQAILLFLDETGVHEDAPIGTTWAEKGTRPVVKVTGKRNRTNVISAIAPHGRLWFRCFEGYLNAARFIDFLDALLHDFRGKIVIVTDKHPAHVAAATRRYLHAKADRLTVHFLPGYAPDMNPDEHVWSYLKGTFRTHPLDEGGRLTEAVQVTMEEIAADRSLVRSFFEHPAVAYVKEALDW